MGRKAMIDFTTITACGECCTDCAKKKDGSCQVLTSTDAPRAVLKMEKEYGPVNKRYKSTLSYLRLQTEFAMEAGDQIIFCGDKVNKANNMWTPALYAWDWERAKSEAYLSVNE